MSWEPLRSGMSTHGSGNISENRKVFQTITGDVPSPTNPPSGCHFHPRCPIFLNESENSPLKQKCKNIYPNIFHSGGALVRCHGVSATHKDQ